MTIFQDFIFYTSICLLWGLRNKVIAFLGVIATIIVISTLAIIIDQNQTNRAVKKNKSATIDFEESDEILRDILVSHVFSAYNRSLNNRESDNKNYKRSHIQVLRNNRNNKKSSTTPVNKQKIIDSVTRRTTNFNSNASKQMFKGMDEEVISTKSRTRGNAETKQTEVKNVASTTQSQSNGAPLKTYSSINQIIKQESDMTVKFWKKYSTSDNIESSKEHKFIYISSQYQLPSKISPFYKYNSKKRRRGPVMFKSNHIVQKYITTEFFMF